MSSDLTAARFAKNLSNTAFYRINTAHSNDKTGPVELAL